MVKRGFEILWHLQAGGNGDINPSMRLMITNFTAGMIWKAQKRERERLWFEPNHHRDSQIDKLYIRATQAGSLLHLGRLPGFLIGAKGRRHEHVPPLVMSLKESGATLRPG